MDFGVPGLEGPTVLEYGAPSHPTETKPQTPGSGVVKQERSSGSDGDHWKSSKFPRTDDLSAPKTMPLQQETPLLRSHYLISNDSSHQEQMLSFSSVKEEVPFLGNVFVERGGENRGLSYYQQLPSTYTRNAGYGSGNLNASLHGVKGPLTQSQWIELEHQALIYKYITANVPVPSNLLIPLKKALYPYGFSSSSAGSLPHNPFGWGSFHLGYANSTDPEPGRCRRTDGKKWRCSRDAVPDQKYCERHINRGRHRSRKPVEGQTGHSASGTTTSRVAPVTSSTSASVITSGGASNSLTFAGQFKNLQSANPYADMLVNRAQGTAGGLSGMCSAPNLKSNPSFSITKQGISVAEYYQSGFGHVTFDSLVNPSQGSSYVNPKEYGSFLSFSDDQETQDQNPLRPFMDDWPKDNSSHSVITWPEELKSDRTKLSMSIPMASPEFSSSSSSPTREKPAHPSLRLSGGFDLIQMGPGFNSRHNEPNRKQPNWMPISLGTSLGGPLGEALTNTANTMATCKNSTLNLLTKRWDESPPLGTSPTGFLQKPTFGSLSNSSSGSSPTTENKKTQEGARLRDDVLGSAVLSSAFIPSL